MLLRRSSVCIGATRDSFLGGLLPHPAASSHRTAPLRNFCGNNPLRVFVCGYFGRTCRRLFFLGALVNVGVFFPFVNIVRTAMNLQVRVLFSGCSGCLRLELHTWVCTLEFCQCHQTAAVCPFQSTQSGTKKLDLKIT